MTNKKKKKIWSLLVLSGALVALLGVYVGLKGKDVSEENLENGKIEENPVYILDWNEKKTQKISIRNNSGEKISFTKENETWKWIITRKYLL